jgi:DNA-binding GntR family transcriptional regulator
MRERQTAPIHRGGAKGALVSWLAGRIVEHLRTREVPPGAHITEQALADHFQVSRTPVRQALANLARLQAVEHRPNRGYYVTTPPAAIPTSQLPELDEDSLYYRISEDRLARRIGEQVTEAELARRYQVPRPRIHAIVTRMAQEGWLQRLPGHGWAFQPMLDSAEGYAEGYRFRAIIEPAALRQPGYRLSPEAIARCRTQQQAVLANDSRYTDAEIFRIGADFHETLVSGANNSLLLDAVRRVNALRRLLEYRAKRNRDQLPRQYREHLRLLNLIETGELERAAVLLEKHLDVARKKKSPLVA